MQKILFKVWIDAIYDDENRKVKGTGCLSEEFTQSGIFHAFIPAMDSNFPTYAVAIVTDDNGRVHEFATGRIKFVY